MLRNISRLVVLIFTLVAAKQKPFNAKNHKLKSGKASIVFIMTDDQDLHMDSMDNMPLVKKYITDHGTNYQRHYCTTAICCPSRVSLLTGRLSHNTNVTDVGAPYGQLMPEAS